MADGIAGADMMEWPSERRAREDRQRRGVPSAYGMLDDLTRMADGRWGKARELGGDLLRAFRDHAEPAATVRRLENELRAADASGLPSPEETAGLAMACVEALSRKPSSDLWEYLWSLAWHSALLEHSLPQVVVAAANADASFKEAFARIAAEVVRNAAENPGRRGIAREKTQARHLRNDWSENPSLSRLWWGHVEQGATFLHRDDDGVFGIMASLDVGAFGGLLASLDNAYSVLAALNASGARWQFKRWQELTAIAPPAFHPDGTWNGSAALPLLLYLGRAQLQPQVGRDMAQEDLNRVTEETDELVRAVAETVAVRPDAAGCGQRWPTWLMRGAITALSHEPRPFPADVRSRGYVDTALIDALAKLLPGDGWRPSPAPDAEAWESWCYRCVRISVANALGDPMPGVDDFLSEWRLSPEDWPLAPGRLLRAHASLFATLGRRADAYGMRVLALPMVQVPDALGVWNQLWETTGPIREIVEFGDPEVAPEDAWRPRSEAGQLMRLVFGLGLMMMDHIIIPIRALSYDRRAVLEGLLRALYDAVNEMAPIDHFDQGYWGEATRHLAVRRAVWLAGKQPVSPATYGTIAFDDETRPRLQDFIRGLLGDVQALLGLVEVARRNGVDAAMLKQALGAAGVELEKETDLAERLIALDPKRAGITSEQVAAAKALFDQD
jgi:hypothetical protein